MELEDYKLSIDIRIDWSDLDMYRHVNNLTFMRFMQSGRVNFGKQQDYLKFMKRPAAAQWLSLLIVTSKNPCTTPG